MSLDGQAAPTVVVLSAVRTDTKNNSDIYYDVQLRNARKSQVRFSSLCVEWTYDPGWQSSIGLGDILVAARPYVVNLELEVDAWHGRNDPLREVTALEPELVIQPREVGSFPLQLHYTFVGRIDWHPQFNWDITFRLFLTAKQDQETFDLVGMQSWRHNERLYH